MLLMGLGGAGEWYSGPPWVSWPLPGGNIAFRAGRASTVLFKPVEFTAGAGKTPRVRRGYPHLVGLLQLPSGDGKSQSITAGPKPANADQFKPGGGTLAVPWGIFYGSGSRPNPY